MGVVTQRIDDGALEILHVHTGLADMAEASLRKKFAESQREDVVRQIADELTDGRLYLGDVRRGEIQITGIARIMTNRFWTEVEYTVLFPPKTAGGAPVEGTYRCIRWNVGVECGAAVLCITTTGEIALQREFRHAQRRWCIGIPRGLRQPGESIEMCGLREAKEERGVVRTDATRVIDLGEFDPDNGVLMSRPRIIAVTNVEFSGSNRDVSESVIGPLVLPAPRVFEMIRTGEIPDGFTRAAMLSAMLHGLIAPPPVA